MAPRPSTALLASENTAHIFCNGGGAVAYFWNGLQNLGIDCIIDKFSPNPPVFSLFFSLFSMVPGITIPGLFKGRVLWRKLNSLVFLLF